MCPFLTLLLLEHVCTLSLCLLVFTPLLHMDRGVQQFSRHWVPVPGQTLAPLLVRASVCVAVCVRPPLQREGPVPFPVPLRGVVSPYGQRGLPASLWGHALPAQPSVVAHLSGHAPHQAVVTLPRRCLEEVKPCTGQRGLDEVLPGAPLAMGRAAAGRVGAGAARARAHSHSISTLVLGGGVGVRGLAGEVATVLGLREGARRINLERERGGGRHHLWRNGGGGGTHWWREWGWSGAHEAHGAH